MSKKRAFAGAPVPPKFTDPGPALSLADVPGMPPEAATYFAMRGARTLADLRPDIEAAARADAQCEPVFEVVGGKGYELPVLVRFKASDALIGLLGGRAHMLKVMAGWPRPSSAKSQKAQPQACGCPGVVDGLKGKHLPGCGYVRDAVRGGPPSPEKWAKEQFDRQMAEQDVGLLFVGTLGIPDQGTLSKLNKAGVRTFGQVLAIAPESPPAGLTRETVEALRLAVYRRIDTERAALASPSTPTPADDFDEHTPPPRSRPKGDALGRYLELPPGEPVAELFHQWDRDGRIPPECVLAELTRDGYTLLAAAGVGLRKLTGRRILPEKLEAYRVRITICQSAGRFPEVPRQFAVLQPLQT